jgi:hypothetical protein
MSGHAPDAQVRHRFFRAMVLMGGSLAVGCGGTAIAGSDSGGSGGGGGGSGGPGGSGAGGSGGSGGPGGTGGGIVLDAGVGSVGGSFPVDGGPMPCVPAQWDCAGAQPTCVSNSGYELPQGCVCDGTRPSTEADCGADESFTCLKATTVGGQPLSNVVPFECSCVATQQSCALTCAAAFDPMWGYSSCDVRSSDWSTVLCGCAVVLLR